MPEGFAPKGFPMPLYDYHCDACDKQFELLARSSDVPTCPTCGTSQIKRLVSPIAPAGKAKAVAGAMRAAAAREGHLSNFRPSER
jgi:putative FmdB family regulatory protein